MKNYRPMLKKRASMRLAAWMIFAGMLVALLPQAMSQEQYTLTNGRLWWSAMRANEDPAVNDWRYPVAFNKNAGWAKIHLYRDGEPRRTDTTHITTMGEVYLALDTTGEGNIAVVDTAHFSPFCVWTRTGSRGYYYQRWGDYRYYLLGTKNSLRVLKLSLTDAMDESAKWYDWDYGAALTVRSYRDGDPSESYYWMVYDTIGTDATHGHWGMSCDSYQRPEDIIYNGYTGEPAVDNMNRTYYCPRVLTINDVDTVIPYGVGALYMPVKYIDHDKQIANMPDGKGLTALNLRDGGGALQSTLKYGEELTIDPVIDVMDGGQPLRVQVVPAHTEYAEETYRYGISLNYNRRTAEEFGKSGVATIRHHYYYGSPVTRHDEAPATTTEALVVMDTVYTIPNSSRRFLQLDTTGAVAKLRCISVPPDGIVVRLLATVRYSNGTQDTLSVAVSLSAFVESHPMPTPTRGPVVHGIVAGGGRIAHVTGGTNVAISSCDSILAVYGGNDIAGMVSDGATLQIGTDKTSASHPVRIGSVYGGGNGLYLYRGVTNGVDEETGSESVHPYADGTKSLIRKSYWFNGEVYPYSYTPGNFGNADTAALVWDPSKRVVETRFSYDTTGAGGNGLVPYLKKVNLTVGIAGDEGTHNDYIYVDTLFGGARNAYIGALASEAAAPDTCINVSIHGGTMFAVFGGNNYGGRMANASLLHVQVYGTKLTDEEATENTYFSGFGRDFGIRHLFGGGNKVVSSYTNVVISGGMTDTCFLGGNAATVLQPVGTVACYGDSLIFENDSLKVDFRADFASLRNHVPGTLRTGFGRYNVRCLFGGNNHAPMDNLSTINLLSGGVASCYGGGNAGDMRNSVPVDNARYNGPSMRLTDSISLCLDGGWEYGSPRVLGSIIRSTPGSKILVENIYGGCRMANVKNSSALWLRGGAFGYVYGGNDVSGDVGSETGEGTWAVVSENAIVLEDIYGGSNGQYHCRNSKGRYVDGELLVDRFGNLYDPYDDYVDMLVPTHDNTNLYLKGGTVLARAYGGGVMTNVGFKESNSRILLRDSADFTGTAGGIEYEQGERKLTPSGGVQKGSVHIMMNNASVGREGFTSHGRGNAYGGGYLSSVYGLSYFKVKGTTAIRGSLYAGNDCVGSIEGFGAYKLPGGTYESFKASDGTTVLNKQDGSGTWNAIYSAYVLIEDTPQITCVYGSGNGAYDYDGTRPEYSSLEPVCLEDAEDNRPFQSSTFIDINVSGGRIDTVFGGGNGVGVSNNVQVFFNSPETVETTVGTIFGGNNRDAMKTCVPDVILKSGVVENVYGGGNAGAMEAFEDDITDVCGNIVKNVSTYVKVESSDVTIKGSLYGGCRMADVKHMAFIDIRNTNAEGIGYVYGGNDVSGTVRGNTRVDVSGGTVHHIYGGSNGRYDYEQVNSRRYRAYDFRSAHSPATLVSDSTSGMPFVDSTTVNLYGGNLTSNVYGGSSMGDCRATYVAVNDQVCDLPGLVLSIGGSVYGGGEGYWQDLNEPRRGNVTRDAEGRSGATHVHLYHAASLGEGGTPARVYGGGRGGDVENTYVVAYPTWDRPFDYLYGGCWGSDVTGTAHIDFTGATDGSYSAMNIFGGNDFTGSVYKSVVNLRKGRFQYVYGAGNGEYDTSAYRGGVYAPAEKQLKVPNNEYVVVNIDSADITANLYGGGRFGTCMAYKKDAEREYVLDAYGHKIPDTSSALTDVEDYSYVLVNIHGGTVGNNVYAGGAGKAGGRELVYGLKQVNMDGGTINESLYGGSENVNDGYRAECDSTGAFRKKQINPETSRPYGRTAFTGTTQRPSSVLNMTGGIVKGNVYGGGYLGSIYGSVYINVGVAAVDKSLVWSSTINGVDSAYWSFKPGVPGGKVDALAATEMQVQHAIYGGANWGSGGGSSDFSVPGVFGGETRIIIDGEGYNTFMNAEQERLPLMMVVESVLGSGTSAAGGDVYNRIDLRNYGSINDGICTPSRTMKSIQRTDALWLNETAINYTGATDAISAYRSQLFTINRVDTVNAIGYNVVDVEKSIANISEVNFYKHSDWPYDTRVANLVGSNLPERCTDAGDCDACALTPSTCDLLADFHRKGSAQWNGGSHAYTAFLIQNGVNVDFISTDNVYSPIFGYAYLIAQNGTNAVVTAMPKYTGLTADPVKGEYGGFLPVCSDSLQVIESRGGEHGEELTWAFGDDATAEYPYYNYGLDYRVWSIGRGTRSRHAVILAHSNPDTLYTIMGDDTIRLNKKFTKEFRGVLYNFSVAKASLTLPPASPGHYYKLNTDSPDGVFNIEEDNNELKMTDVSFLPKDWNLLDNKWYVDEIEGSKAYTPGDPQESTLHGTWDSLTSEPATYGMSYVFDNPGSWMSLMLSPGINFERNDDGSPVRPDAVPDDGWKGYTTVLGGGHVSEFNNYTTSKVGGMEYALPELDLYLVYSNDFNHTLLGTVTFSLDEWVSVPTLNGNGDTIGWTERNLNRPINVTVEIQTILQDFKDMDYEVLAMYNEGRTNTFSRKIVLPATLQHRELYLTEARWAPTDTTSGNGEWIDGPLGSAPDYFYLTNDSLAIVTPMAESNLFRMTMKPVDNVTNTVSSTLGWHTISLLEPLDIVEVTGKSGSNMVSAGQYYAPEEVPVVGATARGFKLGELDGRSEAAINLSLNFDGRKVYNDINGKGYVGKVEMTLVSYTGGNYSAPNEFKVTVNVKTRRGGDTIYVASAGSVTRGGYTVYKHSGSLNEQHAGKMPSKYLDNFKDAFSSEVYQEGDVIAILDTMKIANGTQLFIRGYDFSPVPVIRYTGHHKDLPGDRCVYRGPMIMVSGQGSSFTARCINFDGSLAGKALNNNGYTSFAESQRLYNVVTPSDTYKFGDTNCAYGPILMAKDGATLALQNGTIVENNYNGYLGADKSLYGTINVTSGAKFSVVNNVTIKNNLSALHPSASHTHPYGGAVYVYGGRMTLNESAKSAAVQLKDNYLKGDGAYWTAHTETIKVNGTPQTKMTRYEFDTASAKVDSYKKANVLLGREPRTGDGLDEDMNDELSSLIVFSNTIPSATRIGISKWFPDDAEVRRDTIQAVYQADATHLAEAIADSVFFPDEDGYFMFYNYGVNNQRIYLQRCATFRYQSVGSPLALEDQGSLVSYDALRYLPNAAATCPTGGDTIVYAVQGGFFPYTYRWTGYSDQSRTVHITNNEMNNLLASGDTTLYRSALVDTLITSYVGMTHQTNEALMEYTVVANDATGHCALVKNMAVTLRKRPTTFTGSLEKINPAAWTDVANNPGDTAKANRNYRAVKVEPMVWADRSQGTIVARLDSPDADSVYVIEGNDNYVVNDLYFCEGDVIRLATAPRRDGAGNPVSRFLMWDFDPYGNNPTTYVVPARDSVVLVAYYGPFDHWSDSVNTPAKAGAALSDTYNYTSRPVGAGYVTTREGDVHIYDERGLAWFISVANGLNGAQSRQFYYNKVFLHKKGDGTDYDMKSRLWTPVGGAREPFRGWFIGTSEVETDTVRLPYNDHVVVKNIIVDEPDLAYAGFFGVVDTARISGVKLVSAFVRGAQYVGGMAGYGKDTKVDNCSVADSAEYSSAMTLLATRYASGGLLAKAEGGVIDRGDVRAKFVGSAVYSGGIVGHGTAVDIRNSLVTYGSNMRHMEGVYLGGIGGYLDGAATEGGFFRRAKAGRPSRLRNNYVRMETANASQYAGGIAGYAKNTEIENNYVYGAMPAGSTGGVAAVMDGNAQADRNYYERGSAASAVASVSGQASEGASATFSGRGNRVTLNQSVAGASNLTLALNRWVRTQNAAGEQFCTWRSDLEGVNHGYPIYGEPDMIPVDASLTVEGCGSVEWQGRYYANGESVTVHIVDSVEMVDSALTVRFVVHAQETTAYSDSVTAGEEYSGHGFELSAAETRLLAATVDSLGYGMVVLSDTLSNRYGCDSVISLTLVVWAGDAPAPMVEDTKVLVYPNPTTDKANVVANGLSKVEVYDGEGRRLMYTESADGDRVEVDLRQLPTGVYYLRVHTQAAVTVEKVVKK